MRGKYSMKRYIVNFIGLCSILIMISLLGGCGSIGDNRFLLYRDDMENYVSDELYNRDIQSKGTSYLEKDEYLYTYGEFGFSLVNLNTGEIRYLFDENTNIGFIEFTASKWIEEKRVKENLDKPYIIILPDEKSLNEEQLYIRDSLKSQYIKYPIMSISSGSN